MQDIFLDLTQLILSVFNTFLTTVLLFFDTFTILILNFLPLDIWFPFIPWSRVFAGVIIAGMFALSYYVINKRARSRDVDVKIPVPTGETPDVADPIPTVLQNVKDQADNEALKSVLRAETEAALVALKEVQSAGKIDKKSFKALEKAYQVRLASLSKDLTTSEFEISPETQLLEEQLKSLRQEAKRREQEIQALSSRVGTLEPPGDQSATPPPPAKQSKPSTSVPPTSAPAAMVPKSMTEQKPAKKKPLPSLDKGEAEPLIDEMLKAIQTITQEFKKE